MGEKRGRGEESGDGAGEDSGKKQHICETCGQAFSKSGVLTQHLLTHTKERPYLCAKCGDSFARSDTLARHVMTHSGDKPHAC